VQRACGLSCSRQHAWRSHDQDDFSFASVQAPEGRLKREWQPGGLYRRIGLGRLNAPHIRRCACAKNTLARDVLRRDPRRLPKAIMRELDWPIRTVEWHRERKWFCSCGNAERQSETTAPCLRRGDGNPRADLTFIIEMECYRHVSDDGSHQQREEHKCDSP